MQSVLEALLTILNDSYAAKNTQKKEFGVGSSEFGVGSVSGEDAAQVLHSELIGRLLQQICHHILDFCRRIP